MFAVPDRNCPACPRLRDFREECRSEFPDKFNAPVPSFGPEGAQFLIVGLAPGLRGANFTGRPFTGDYAGELLYGTLLKFGLAKGEFLARPDDGLQLVNARITNAVRCLPPENKPIGEEINNCRPFLESEIKNLKNLKVILCLGLISHNSVIKALGGKVGSYKFVHGAVHEVANMKVIDSYHCSRYNTNTGRLTTEMFESVFSSICKLVSNK